MSTKHSSTTKQPIPKWFNGQIYKEGGKVTNPYSGESYDLNALELSMYDFVMGASVMSELGMLNTPHHIQQLRKGLDWFRTHNATAYMVLLD